MFATLAGGYPWPIDLAPDDALAVVVAAQVEAGLGIVSDGRLHAAEASIDEVVTAWTETSAAAARLAPGLAAKVAVVGPWASGGVAGAGPAAEALGARLVALADAGCPVVEVHEPAGLLPVDGPGRAAFAAAHVLLLAPAAGRLHASLAITGGDALALGAGALFAAPYQSHLFDLVDGPESWRLVVVAPRERGIIAGVGDASGGGRTQIEDITWAAGYAASTQGRTMERVGLAPSGSLAPLGAERARAVIDLLGEAADAILAGGEAILPRLDPRAIDARSAALGQYQARRRRRPGG
jgi:hypothetical protein